jgi:hypothetical protein
MNFTSQIGQDRWVCEKFNYKKNGYFLNLGAYDGIFYDNTYYLEKELGWKGLSIEPDKVAFEKLIKNRNCICVNKALSGESKMMKFTKPGQHGYIKEDGELLVEAITIEKLMVDYNIPFLIDYISMDIEWQEIPVLSTFPFNKYETILWTIEHNLYSDGTETKQRIKEIMISNGYMIDQENMSAGDGNMFEDWYINKKYADELGLASGRPF